MEYYVRKNAMSGGYEVFSRNSLDEGKENFVLSCAEEEVADNVAKSFNEWAKKE